MQRFKVMVEIEVVETGDQLLDDRRARDLVLLAIEDGLSATRATTRPMRWLKANARQVAMIEGGA